MKKKIAAAICMILIGTSLAACGGSSANENNTGENIKFKNVPNFGRIANIYFRSKSK